MKTTRVRQHTRRTRSGTTGVVKHERRIPDFLRMQDHEQRGVKFKINPIQTIAIFKNPNDIKKAFPYLNTDNISPAFEREYQSEEYDDKYSSDFKKSTKLFTGILNNQEIQTGIDRNYYNHFKREGYTFYLIDNNRPLIAKKGSKSVLIAPKI